MTHKALPILLQLMARLLLIAAFLFLITRQNPDESSPPEMLPTDHLDLQLVRLYQQTNGTWTPAAQEQLNTLLSARGDYEMVARRLPYSDSPSLPVLWVVAQQQHTEQNWQSLEQTLNAVLAIDPTHTEANLWQALLKLPNGIHYLEVASSTAHEKQPLVASLLGVVSVEGYMPFDVAIRLIEVGEWPFAERFLTLQIEQDSLDAAAYAYRGFVRDQLGKDGLSDIQQAIALEPSLALGAYMLGLHERQQGNTVLSVNALQDAYLLDPNNPALAAEVATGFQLTGDFEQAEEWFGLAVSLAPEDVRFITLQAAFYADNNYRLEAQGFEFIQRAVEDYPENASLLTSLGKAYFEKGQFEEAESALQQALLVAPQDARTRYFLGTLAERRGDFAAAQEHYAIVVQTNNLYTESARIALARLF